MNFRVFVVFLAVLQSAILHSEEDAVAKESANTWVAKLKSGGEDSRVESARELIALGDVSIDPVLNLIFDPEAKKSASRQCVFILEKLSVKSEKAALALTQALSSGDDSVRRAATDALTDYLTKCRPAILDAILERFKTCGLQERDELVKTLAKSGLDTLDYLCTKLFSEKGELNEEVLSLLKAAIRKKSSGSLQTGGCLPPWPVNEVSSPRVVAATIHRQVVEVSPSDAKKDNPPSKMHMQEHFSGDPMSVTAQLLPYLKSDEDGVRAQAISEILRLNAYPPLTSAVLGSRKNK
jgi:hypothetical protein